AQDVDAFQIERGAGGGRLHLALVAREQAHAQPVFEFAHVLRHPRLRRALALRRRRERALLVNGHEQAKIAQAPGHRLWSSGIVIALAATYYFAECRSST